MANEIQTLLKTNGPGLTSEFIAALTKTGISESAARKRIQRAQAQYERFAGIRFEKNARFIYLQDQYGDQRFWEKFESACHQAGKSYWSAIVSLKSRGGIVPLELFPRVAGTPTARKGQLSPDRILERLQKINLLEVSNIEERECVHFKPFYYQRDALQKLRWAPPGPRMMQSSCPPWSNSSTNASAPISPKPISFSSTRSLPRPSTRTRWPRRRGPTPSRTFPRTLNGCSRSCSSSAWTATKTSSNVLWATRRSEVPPTNISPVRFGSACASERRRRWSEARCPTMNSPWCKTGIEARPVSYLPSLLPSLPSLLPPLLDRSHRYIDRADVRMLSASVSFLQVIAFKQLLNIVFELFKLLHRVKKPVC